MVELDSFEKAITTGRVESHVKAIKRKILCSSIREYI